MISQVVLHLAKQHISLCVIPLKNQLVNDNIIASWYINVIVTQYNWYNAMFLFFSHYSHLSEDTSYQVRGFNNNIEKNTSTWEGFVTTTLCQTQNEPDQYGTVRINSYIDKVSMLLVLNCIFEMLKWTRLIWFSSSSVINIFHQIKLVLIKFPIWLIMKSL